MEEPAEDFFAASGKQLEQYVRDRILLLKLQAAEKTANVTALLFSLLLISLLLFFILLFVSIMAGFYFTVITGSLYIGFAIVAAFYFLLLIVILLAKKWLHKKIMDMVIRIFFNKMDETDEN